MMYLLRVRFQAGVGLPAKQLRLQHPVGYQIYMAFLMFSVSIPPTVIHCDPQARGKYLFEAGF